MAEKKQNLTSKIIILACRSLIKYKIHKICFELKKIRGHVFALLESY